MGTVVTIEVVGHEADPHQPIHRPICREDAVAEAFEWKKRWHAPGADSGPIKRGAGMAFMALRSPLGQSSAVVRLDSNGRYTVFVGVTDIGAGAKTTAG